MSHCTASDPSSVSSHQLASQIRLRTAWPLSKLPERALSGTNWLNWTPFSYPFNLTQQPALSVPCGFTADGLPVGLQLVAPPYREDLALRAAHAFQSATDHLRRPPV